MSNIRAWTHMDYGPTPRQVSIEAPGQRGFFPVQRAFDREQLTLNQRVQGSNPCTPTNDVRRLAEFRNCYASQKSRLGSMWEARLVLRGGRSERPVVSSLSRRRISVALRMSGTLNASPIVDAIARNRRFISR